MENTEVESEPQQSFSSPPRRRRSTFFERRDSLVPQIDNKDHKLGFQNAKNSNEHNEEMHRYYESLLSEKEQWKKEVKKRKNEYHDLRQQFLLEAKSKSRLSYSTLTNEDIEYLKGKPSIAFIKDCQMKLHNSVKVLITLNERSTELDNVIIKNCEDKLKKITSYILENSTVDAIADIDSN